MGQPGSGRHSVEANRSQVVSWTRSLDLLLMMPTHHTRLKLSKQLLADADQAALERVGCESFSWIGAGGVSSLTCFSCFLFSAQKVSQTLIYKMALKAWNSGNLRLVVDLRAYASVTTQVHNL